eukprot:IDg6649t1
MGLQIDRRCVDLEKRPLGDALQPVVIICETAVISPLGTPVQNTYGVWPASMVGGFAETGGEPPLKKTRKEGDAGVAEMNLVCVKSLIELLEDMAVCNGAVTLAVRLRTAKTSALRAGCLPHGGIEVTHMDDDSIWSDVLKSGIDTVINLLSRASALPPTLPVIHKSKQQGGEMDKSRTLDRDELEKFVASLGTQQCAIPDELVRHYLAHAGFITKDVRLERLIALAAQKFLADIAFDAIMHSRLRTQATPSTTKKKIVHDARIVLTIDDLERAL